MIGLTSLRIKGRPMASPKFNRRRALFVLGKIDEILAWEKTKEQERDVRYVDLGRYLCGVRIGQYWRLERLKSFDEFLERRFPESRRKAYYIMTIHEHLTRIPKRELRQIGWAKAEGATSVATIDNCELLFNGTAVSSGTNGFRFVGGSKIAFNGAAFGGSGSNSSYGTSRIHTNGSNGTFTPISQQ